jgi:predicted ABC-type transport system involved in lysophospholipase L1 biosynthesis ATPase subunit
MGKSSGKMIETLVLPGQPRRYIVNNGHRVVLVTHDAQWAQRIQQALLQLPQPHRYQVRV